MTKNDGCEPLSQEQSVSSSDLAERDRLRWHEIQRLFEFCRERPRGAWHATLREACAGREGIAFEVLTLLVAAENLPPIESREQNSTVG
ncbi:MAG: hypothetical protein ACKO3W_04530 [bacterium]